ncbi:MAG TPA: efflux RND transporter periplasmic adaptor subunit [Gemmatimonadaceae bacterium]|nr:efflux RND transporter periplasmic adaptor subunit [Gemmatimonadaceae bacterium]
MLTTRGMRYLFSAFLLAACNGAGDDLPEATGTVELTETDVAAAVSARVSHVRVEEGDAVKQGDTLAALELTTLPADIEQRRARLSAAEAELRDLLAGSRGTEIARAESELAAAEAEAKRTADEARRYAELLKTGSVSESQVEAYETAARVAAGKRDAARATLQQLREGTRPERITAARANVAAARAQVEAARATATDLILVAPSDGVVLGRYAEPGELLAAGVPVIALGDPARLWVRVYVGPTILTSLRVGQPVRATIDGVPGKEFSGSIVQIATRAEFTPRVALTEQERADLLFGVKIALEDKTGALKAGLPVRVHFSAENEP